MSEVVRLAHSPDPDDAFMFYALARGLVDTEGLDLEVEAADVEALNARGDAAELAVTAASVGAMPGLAKHYKILDPGASFGVGYGPIVVAREELSLDALRSARVAIPGFRTSAWLAYRLAVGAEPPAEHLYFAEILDAVADGRFDVGVVIHEGQLTYGDHGLRRLLDLGEWWQQESGLPLPLGVNAIRRGLEPNLEARIARVVQRAIRYGLDHREDALRYARSFGRGIGRERADRFVAMYVNDLTVSMGARGREAIRAFLTRGWKAGWVDDPNDLEFVG
jgi:1,4-dihydroxy-6-naphthoate synthase